MFLVEIAGGDVFLLVGICFIVFVLVAGLRRSFFEGGRLLLMGILQPEFSPMREGCLHGQRVEVCADGLLA